jgi:hypothetical protein
MVVVVAAQVRQTAEIHLLQDQAAVVQHLEMDKTPQLA